MHISRLIDNTQAFFRVQSTLTMVILPYPTSTSNEVSVSEAESGLSRPDIPKGAEIRGYLGTEKTSYTGHVGWAVQTVQP